MNLRTTKLVHKISSIFVISLLLVQTYLGGASMEIHHALRCSRCAHKKRRERGRTCLVIAGDLVHPMCLVLADDLVHLLRRYVASIFSGDLVLAGRREMDVLVCGSTLLCFLYSSASKTTNHMVKAVANQDVKQLQNKMVYRGDDG
ncbi:hypothetical protein L6452_32164 [Arctium lappa]|uniref:Uncharacterized protein n=1 Tax=Arctium lappa TaxID=4217 RepID=A0ACB8Z824_ARCLA|nr:hypothetical protein L6452_32164 [Arctium lappa]